MPLDGDPFYPAIEPTTDRPSYSEFARLARTDPAAHHVYMAVSLGVCTLEEGLIRLAFWNYEARRSLFKQVLDLVNRRPLPPFVITDLPEEKIRPK